MFSQNPVISLVYFSISIKIFIRTLLVNIRRRHNHKWIIDNSTIPKDSRKLLNVNFTNNIFRLLTY